MADVTISRRLAERICGTCYEDFSADDLHWARVQILDTFGAALAGAAEQGVQILDAVVTGGLSAGPCRLFGSSRRASLLDAVLINGMACHALDFDISNNPFYGHPAVSILSVAFNLGEMADASGRDVLTAYVAGFEAELKIARGVQPRHSDLGWFPSGTIGVFGAAATAARLLGLDADRTAQALGIAASLASGVQANAGTMTKPLTASHAARNGTLAALLAKGGFTSSPHAFEHKEGFLNLFNGKGNHDGAAILAGWGKPFEVVETAVGIKQYPCNGSIHAGIDVLGTLVSRHRIDPDGVERVNAQYITSRLFHFDRPDPRTPLDAKFSVQYVLARTLLQGGVRIEDFEGEAFREPRVRGLMKLINATVHPDTPPDLPRAEQDGVEVEVVMKDGRRFTEKAAKPYGRLPGHPLPAEKLEAKFLDCARRVLTPSAAEDVLALVRQIDRVSMRAILDAMTARPTVATK
ncbi:MAG: MmgE/PrpD family protein [Dongiaceae bacterium]